MYQFLTSTSKFYLFCVLYLCYKLKDNLDSSAKFFFPNGATDLLWAQA